MGWNGLRSLLDVRMASLPGASGNLISWQGFNFTPPSGDDSALWWKVSLLPAAVDPEMGPSGAAHEQGIYQVSVFAKANAGTGPLLEAVDALVNHFARYRATAAGVTVQCGVPTPGPLIQEASWIQVPVSIPFTSL